VIHEVQSSIHSHMKHFSSLDVKSYSLLRVKRNTVVFTGQQKCSHFDEGTGKEEVISSNHIIIN